MASRGCQSVKTYIRHTTQKDKSFKTSIIKISKDENEEISELNKKQVPRVMYLLCESKLFDS